MLRHEGSTPGLPYFGLRHPASAQRRIREQGIRLDAVGHASVISAQEIVRNDLVVVVRRVCEGAVAVAVTQRPDAGYARLQLIVDDDVAAFVGPNPGPVESEVARVGSASHREEDMRADDFGRTLFA